MLAGILIGLFVLAAALLVFGDFRRTGRDSTYWHDDEGVHDASPWAAGDARSGAAEAFHPEAAGRAAPPAGHDASLAGRPDGIRQAAGGHQHARTGGPAGRSRSRRELKDWPISARLLLLIIIPAVAVAVIAFCVVRLADALRSTSIHSAISSVHDRSILLAIVVGVVAVVVLVLALWLMTAVFRSVVKPVRKLQAGAREVDDVWLPEAIRRITENNGENMPSAAEPIDVDSSDEIGEIAHVFNQMRTEMLRLAGNEAALRGRLDAMFVKLSHRNQSLVERQIRLIENLEQGEQDRERLSSLYKMSRIASRMHRNSQNLLVVAGHEVPSDWNQPIPLLNVIRAAAAEVEDYERVSLNAQPDIAVSGPAVNDVVHLLAELIENATSFSAGDMLVDVSGHRLASGGVLVDITDRGVGMAPKELAYANWRLENPPTTDINVPKWMGLFVVATLAARHGIKIRLQQAEFGGLMALTWLPDEVITNQPTAPPVRLSRLAGSRPRSHAHHQATDPGLAAAATATAAPTVAATAEQRVIARTPEFVPRDDVLDLPSGRRIAADTGRRPGPLSGRAAQWRGETPQEANIPAGTDAPAGQENSFTEPAVVMPAAEDSAERRGLPIYESIESNWFRGGQEGSNPPGNPPVSTAGHRWSSPADAGWNAAQTVDSPSAGAPTAAGLPRRMPNANLVPGAIPSTSTETVVPTRSPAAVRDRLAGFQRGVLEARAAGSEAAGNAGEGES
jgi:signal transduction histidine kinase